MFIDQKYCSQDMNYYWLYKYTELTFLEKIAVNVCQEVHFFVHDGVNNIQFRTNIICTNDGVQIKYILKCVQIQYIYFLSMTLCTGTSPVPIHNVHDIVH